MTLQEHQNHSGSTGPDQKRHVEILYVFGRVLKWTASVLLCATLLLLGQQIISRSLSNQKDRMDLAEINHIKYGLFSVDEWKRQLSEIVSEEISEFRFTGKNKKELKKHVEEQLGGLIDKVQEKIKETNQSTFKGRIKQSLMDAFVDMKAIKAGIPGYADAIVGQLAQPKTENTIKGMVRGRVDKYFDKTFSEQDLTDLDRVLLKTSSPDIATAREKLQTKLAASGKVIWLLVWTLIALSVVLFAVFGLSKKGITRPVFLLFLLNLTVLLVAGVSTPMIDLEAKISKMSFTLMDHQIQFLDQVLYYQSKSIVDVFWVMITHPDIQMKVVGVLVITFSIIFPFAKLLSSFVYYFDFRKGSQNRLVRFFVIKSGKWSMTDVLVVAIFMAFIGFNGIISSQFAKLKSVASDMDLLTTNGTVLQQGFFLFMTYAMLSLILSVFITRKGEGRGA